MSLRFDGQTIVITGASHGLGHFYATYLASRGANIVVHDIDNRKFAADLVAEIRAIGGNAIENHTSLEDGGAIIAAAILAFGGINALILNAGDDLDADWAGTGQDVWDSMLDSFRGSYKCVHGAWAYFKKQQYGRILCTSSLIQREGAKRSFLQSVITYGQLGFVQTLAKEGSKYNILASVLGPASTIGLMQVEPEAVAQAVSSLIHSSNANKSGHLYEIDNGQCKKLRWQRSSGALLNPGYSMTPGAIAARWGQVNNFSSPSYPSAAADLQTLLAEAKSLPPSTLANGVRLDGRVALVTGAGSGLGRAYAKYMASLGACVVLNDLKKPTSVVEEIRSAKGEAHMVTCSAEEGEKIVTETIKKYGRLDILVNNAGFVRDKSIGNMTDERWDAVMAVHLTGAFRVTKAAWSHLVKQRYGRIVNVSSTSGIYGNFGQTNYSTAKCAVIGFSEALAREGARHNIFVNTIAPVGSTAGLAAAVQGMGEDLLPEYCAPFVALLSSDTVMYPSTGCLYELAGGWHARTRLQSIQEGMLSYPEESEHGLKGLIAQLPQSSVLARIKDAKTRQIRGTIFEYNEKEVVLYNLTLGATCDDLPLVYERNHSFHALPTFGAVPYFNTMLPFNNEDLFPDYDPTKLLHGEHYLEIRKYLIPTAGKLITHPRLVDVVDKKKAALMVLGYTTRDADTGEDIFYNEASAYIRGAGGFGGPTGSKSRPPSTQPPSRPPDAIFTERTTREQAVLYRLNGDRNAVHVDPSVSHAGGFSRPILHGLCFFGIAGKHVLKEYGPIRNIRVRFAGTVDPGQTLRTEMWKEDDGTVVLFHMKIVETGMLCISRGRAMLLGGLLGEGKSRL